MNRLNSNLRKRAPFTLLAIGLGLTALGFALQILGHSPAIMARLDLGGTIFGLLSKLGGPFVFAVSSRWPFARAPTRARPTGCTRRRCRWSARAGRPRGWKAHRRAAEA